MLTKLKVEEPDNYAKVDTRKLAFNRSMFHDAERIYRASIGYAHA